jgi:hypothetical protein
LRLKPRIRQAVLHAGYNATVSVVLAQGLPLFNRALVLEVIALIAFAGLVIAFVHGVVPYLAD